MYVVALAPPVASFVGNRGLLAGTPHGVPRAQDAAHCITRRDDGYRVWHVHYRTTIVCRPHSNNRVRD